MIRPSARPGYAFLVTILILGAVASGLVVTYLLLAVDLARGSQTIRDGAESLALARSCAERALLELRGDANYLGNEDVTVGTETCHIGTIGGSGNVGRSICATGTVGSSTRRIEIAVSTLLPQVLIQSWAEVSAFTLCTGT